MEKRPNPIADTLLSIQTKTGCDFISAVRALIEATIIDTRRNDHGHYVKVDYRYGLEADSIHFAFHNSVMDQDVIKNHVTLPDTATDDERRQLTAQWIATDVWGPYDEFPYAALPKLERVALTKF